MYTPKLYKTGNTEEIREFISANSFGILVSSSEGKIEATHIPFLLHKNRAGEEVLSAHISRANTQLKNTKDGEEVLVIFQGPHAYISSSWYDHENVPTWNYVAVHVYGKLRVIEDEELLHALTVLVDKHEAASQHPVSVPTISSQYIQKEMKGIIGFEIKIERIEGAKKLSQNRDEKNQERIIGELEKRGDPDSKAIATHMKNIKK